MFLMAPLMTTVERERQLATFTTASASSTAFVIRCVRGNRRKPRTSRPPTYEIDEARPRAFRHVGHARSFPNLLVVRRPRHVVPEGDARTPFASPRSESP